MPEPATVDVGKAADYYDDLVVRHTTIIRGRHVVLPSGALVSDDGGTTQSDADPTASDDDGRGAGPGPGGRGGAQARRAAGIAASDDDRSSEPGEPPPPPPPPPPAPSSDSGASSSSSAPDEDPLSGDLREVFVINNIRICLKVFGGTERALAYRRYEVHCRGCSHGYLCRRRRHVIASNCRRHGALEPVAYLLAWFSLGIDCNSRFNHGHSSPTEAQIDAAMLRLRDAGYG